MVLLEFLDRLPEGLRKNSGDGGCHTCLAHELITALVENREPAMDLYESLAMTVPGTNAHPSALERGGRM